MFRHHAFGHVSSCAIRLSLGILFTTVLSGYEVCAGEDIAVVIAQDGVPRLPIVRGSVGGASR